jgi:signal transduction histidine kinase
VSGPVGLSRLRPAFRVLAGPVAPETWRLILALAVSLVLGAAFCAAVALALVLAGVLSWIVAVGTILMATALRLSARLADVDRLRIRRSYDLVIEPARLPARPPGQSLIQAQRDWRGSPVAWRLACYQLIRAPGCAAAGFVLAMFGWAGVGLVFVLPLRGRPIPPGFTSWFFGPGPLGLGVEVVAWLVGLGLLLGIAPLVRGFARLDAAFGQRMLGPDRADILAGEVDRLALSRAQAIDAGDIERHRIERDLHDGVQPRLVSLAMQIDRARARLDRDPERADELLRQAHADAKDALADLPGHNQEAVAYFTAAETIGNLAKHASASQATLRISDESGALVVQMTDDGRGGAVVIPGGGLAGIAGRLASVDGRLAVDSPPGGPTTITAVIPCGS